MHTETTVSEQVPEALRSIYAAQFEALRAKSVPVGFGFASRMSTAQVSGWHWSCTFGGTCLISHLRVVAHEDFTLPERPAVGYSVVSLLSSSDLALMNELWSEQDDPAHAFDGPLHPVLEENVLAFPIEAGSYEFVLRAGTVHDGINVCLLPEFFDTLDAYGIDGPALRGAIAGRLQLNRCTALRDALRATDPRRAARPGAAAYFKARLLDIVAALSDAVGKDPCVPKDSLIATPSLAESVDELLLSSLASPPSLAEIAERLYLSRTQLCTSYKEQTGASVGQRLASLRTEQAKALLMHEGTSLDEVAHAVGYAHQSSFTAAFRRATGTTPAAWRTSQRKGGSEQPALRP